MLSGNDPLAQGCPKTLDRPDVKSAIGDVRQIIRMSKVIRLETGEEPERFFDLEEENVESHQT